MYFLSVCVAEDPANRARAREEKKRFRSRQTASKQGTNHSDSYSRWIDLPRSNAVAREARTFAYVPLPPLGWRTVWVRQGFIYLIVKFCLGNSESIICFIANSTVNLPMVALSRCCCSAVQSIFCSYQTTDLFVKPLGWLWSCLFMIVIFNLVSYERFHLLKELFFPSIQVSFIFKEGSKTCCQFSKKNASAILLLCFCEKFHFIYFLDGYWLYWERLSLAWQ